MQGVLVPATRDAIAPAAQNPPSGDALAAHLDRLRLLLEQLNAVRDVRTQERIIDELRPAIATVRTLRGSQLEGDRAGR
jgi:hypothetical protein